MYGRNNDRGFPPKPVNVGDELDVTIEAVGEKGDGVAKKDGFVLFVPGAQQGERIRVKVTKVLRKVGFAEKVGEAQSEAPAQEQQAPEATPEPAEPTPEDSEDFGEEPSEDAGAEDAGSDDMGSDDAGSEDMGEEEKQE